MIFATYDQLEARVAHRPPGYREFVLSFACCADADGFYLPEEALPIIRTKFGLAPRPEPQPCLGCGG